MENNPNILDEYNKIINDNEIVFHHYAHFYAKSKYAARSIIHREIDLVEYRMGFEVEDNEEVTGIPANHLQIVLKSFPVGLSIEEDIENAKEYLYNMARQRYNHFKSEVEEMISYSDFIIEYLINPEWHKKYVEYSIDKTLNPKITKVKLIGGGTIDTTPDIDTAKFNFTPKDAKKFFEDRRLYIDG